MLDTRRGVLTVAFGAEKYVDMARALSRSLRRHYDGLPIAIVTDRLELDLTRDFDYVTPLRREIGPSLLQKLHIDEYSPFDETLFLDSDCLVVGDLAPLWERFRGQSFVVLGSTATAGEWFGKSISDLVSERAIPGLPLFNGGLMYWRQGTSVFERARELAPSYGELGFSDFRDGLPLADEPVIALAMADLGLNPLPDDYRGMATPIGLSGRLRVDAIRGGARFVKKGRTAEPVVVHFCHPFNLGPSYRQAVGLLDVEREKARSTHGMLLRLIYAPLTLLERGWVWDLVTRLAVMRGKRRRRRARA